MKRKLLLGLCRPRRIQRERGCAEAFLKGDGEMKRKDDGWLFKPVSMPRVERVVGEMARNRGTDVGRITDACR